MEMSLEYMQETAKAMCEHGYALVESSGTYGTPEESENHGIPKWTKFAISMKESSIVLETVLQQDKESFYYLEIINHHGLRSFSFKVDSWKYFPDRVEFKYYVMPDSGTGLSFILALH